MCFTATVISQSRSIPQPHFSVLLAMLQCDYFMLAVHFDIHLLSISFLSVQYVVFTCGLIRGALSNLGINSIVTAEVHSMPACKFHIQVHRI